MSGEWSPALVSVAALCLFGIQFLRYPTRERSYLWAALVCHLLAPYVLVWVYDTVYGGRGDAQFYLSEGRRYAAGLGFRPGQYASEISSFLLEGSTAAMVAVAALGYYALESDLAVHLVLSVIGLLGQVSLYRAFRLIAAPSVRARLALGTLLVPSVLFWTGGVVKEALAVGGLGLATLGAVETLRVSRLAALPKLGWGVLLLALSKPYVLYPLTVAVAVWYAWERTSAVRRRSILARPERLVAGAILAVGGVAALSFLFPQYSPESFTEVARRLQTPAGGQSDFALAEGPARTLTDQIALAPIAALTALFRPAFFEVRNLQMAVGSVETTILAGLLLFGLLGVGPRKMMARTFESTPLLLFFVFTLLFAVGVGLTSSNLGTLSRYRVPMMPFYVSWLLLAGARERRALAESPGVDAQSSGSMMVTSRAS